MNKVYRYLIKRLTFAGTNLYWNLYRAPTEWIIYRMKYRQLTK